MSPHVVIIAIILVFILPCRKWRVWARFHPGARRCYFSAGFWWKEGGDALWSTGESTAHVQVWHIFVSVLIAVLISQLISSPFIKYLKKTCYSSHNLSVGTSIGPKWMRRQIIATASLMETSLLRMRVRSLTMGGTSVKQKTALGPSWVAMLFCSLHVSRLFIHPFKHLYSSTCTIVNMIYS